MNIFSQFKIADRSKWSLGKWLLITMISFLVLWVFSEHYSKRIGDNYAANKIQKSLIEKSKKLNLIIEELGLKEKEDGVFYDALMEAKNETACDIFYLKGDSIKFWTTNLISVDGLDIKNNNIIKLNNGWYNSVLFEYNNSKLIGLIPIKFEYNYNNEFLPETFNLEYQLNDNYDILLEQADHNIWDINGEFLFSIKRVGNSFIPKKHAYILFVLFHILLCFILILLKKLYDKFSVYIKPKWLLPIIIIADVFILWLIVNHIRSPRILFDSFLYSPVVFADQLHSSISSFFTTALLVLFLIYVLFTKGMLLNTIFRKSVRVRVAIMLVLSIIGLFVYEESVLSLFRNSQLTFQFGQDFISNPGFGILIFLVLFILSFCLFLLAYACSTEINKLNLKTKYF